MKSIDLHQVWRCIRRRPSWACAPPGSPVRRGPGLLYLFMISVGGCSGAILTNPALGIIASYDAGTFAILIGCVGLFTGWLTAYWLEERYRTSFNAWPWLALSLSQLIIAPLVLFAIAAFVTVVAAVIGVILGGIFLLIFLIFLAIGSFGG